MNLFPFQTAVGPLTPPLESIEAAAFSRGLNDAPKLPNTTTQIANAVTQGVESYQDAQSKQQQAVLRDQTIAASQRQAERETDPAYIEAENLEIQVKRDEFARAVKTRQRQDELMEVLRSKDNQKIADAVTSGAYADVFASDPKLEQYAVKVAAPSMTPEQQDSFIYSKQNQQYSNMMAAQRLKLEGDYMRSESAYLGSSDTKAILRNNPELNAQTLAKRAEFVPSGKFKYDDEDRIIKDPNTMQYSPMEDANRRDSDPENKDKFDIIDSQTLRVIARGVDKEYRKTFDDFGGSATMVENSNIKDSATVAEIRRARGQRPGVKTPPRKSDKAPTGPRTPNAVEAQTLQAVQQQAKNVKLTNNKGTVTPEAKQSVVPAIAAALPVSPSAKEKFADRLEQVITNTVESTTDNAIADSFSRAEKAFSVAADQLILAEDLLSETWDTQDDGFYTQADVDAHNKQVDEYHAYLKTYPRGNFFAPKENPGMKVDTPKQLYVQKKLPELVSRINAGVAQVNSVAKAQLQAEARKGVKRDAIRKAVAPLK